MREKRKLLALIFVVGVLISGIGAGIGLMEFFSLDYVGERIVGETEMATMEGEEELAYLSEGEDIRFYLGYGTHYLNLNWDDSIPENTVRYRIQYNKEKVKPKFWQHDAAVGFDYPDSDEDRDEMKEVMELRDMILKDLKKGEIGSYQSSPWIGSLDLYLNPKNQDDIEIMEIW